MSADLKKRVLKFLRENFEKELTGIRHQDTQIFYVGSADGFRISTATGPVDFSDLRKTLRDLLSEGENEIVSNNTQNPARILVAVFNQ